MYVFKILLSNFQFLVMRTIYIALKKVNRDRYFLLPCMRMHEQELCDRGWCPFIGERDTLRSVQLRIGYILLLYIMVRAKIFLITRKEGGA